MKPLTRRHQRLLAALLAIGVLSIALTLTLRRTQAFSHLCELPLYDQVTKLTWPWKTGHDDVVLVTIQDAADWPLSDGKLADIIEKLSSAEPSVIAIDLIRDSYRSPDPVMAAVEAETLTTALAWNGDLLVAEGLAVPPYDGFQAHPFFDDQNEQVRQDRIGLAIYPRDDLFGHTVRRGLFSATTPNGEFRFSLAALAAIHAGENANAIPPDPDLLDRIAAFQPDSGGYAIAKQDIGSQFLLKFGPGLDNRLPEYSMADVLQMSEDELRRAFRGKVIFFGTGNTRTAKDEIPVIGNPELRGVKLLALTTSQLLREMTEGEPPVRTSGNALEIALVIMAGLLATLAMWLFRLNGLRRSLLIAMLLAACLAIAAIALKQGIWIPMAAPMLTIVLAGTAGSLLLHRHTAAALRDYSSTLKQQFGDRVAQVIEEHKDQLLDEGTLPGTSFEGSALFSDLLGFTAITEKFARLDKNEEFLAWINHYIAAMVPIVRKHHGVIVKFAGDGIFIVFGFPDEPGHADQAVRCTRDMEAALRDLNAQAAPDADPYFVRIGIYSGPIFAGPVGARERLSYDFLGSTINKAARLETLDKDSYKPAENPSLPPVRTLISDSTQQALADTSGLRRFSDAPSQLDRRLTDASHHEQVWEVIHDS